MLLQRSCAPSFGAEVTFNGVSGDLLSQFLNHAMQMCGRTLNIKVLVLSGAALRGKQGTAVHLLEISVRKFVMFLGIFGFVVVDSPMPLPILAEAASVDKLVFFLSGWLVPAPCVCFVYYDFSFADELLACSNALLLSFTAIVTCFPRPLLGTPTCLEMSAG